ncbi:MAG TPA: type IVB secretion system protein IcmW [Gammaproteobacteria bacterium]|nr:type IVB secretion system protein IcmW [Gammaproteobacteria bacterium]
MPEFDLKSCHKYWKNYISPDVYRVICLMETLEDWCRDNDPLVDEAISKLAPIFSLPNNSEIAAHNEELIKILACVKVSRKLRVMQALDSIQPGTASKLISYAEEKSNEEAPAKIFLRRNVTFERLRLLKRVLAKERLDILTSALEPTE